MAPFNPLKKFRRETTPDPLLPQKEADFRASIQQGSLKVQPEAKVTNWENIGSPDPPKQYSGLNTRNLSAPNYKVPDQVPTTRVGQSFQPNTSPSYPGVDLSSVQSPGVTPGFGSSSLGETRRDPSTLWSKNTPNVAGTYPPNPAIVEPEAFTPQSKISSQPNLAGDMTAANTSLGEQGFDTIGAPIQPTWRRTTELGNLPDKTVFPTHPVTRPTHSPSLTPQQNMEAELNQLRTENIDWGLVDKSHSPRRFPITNGED